MVLAPFGFFVWLVPGGGCLVGFPSPFLCCFVFNLDRQSTIVSFAYDPLYAICDRSSELDRRNRVQKKKPGAVQMTPGVYAFSIER